MYGIKELLNNQDKRQQKESILEQKNVMIQSLTERCNVLKQQRDDLLHVENELLI